VSVVTARTVEEIRNQLVEPRHAKRTIGLVPTMGALHEGHASLIALARKECDVVVVSIFVNPLQFGPNEDYQRYPRPIEQDLEICRQQRADIVFVPEVGDLYVSPQRAFVEVTHLGDHLCGAFRPGHFRGVTTVVAKLLNIVQPDRAYFGEKDFQQLRVLSRMVEDLNMPVTVVPVPIVREPDGLALSSRNAYLTPEERAAAPVLQRALQAAKHLIEEGERDPQVVKAEGIRILATQPLAQLQYFEVVDSLEVQPVGEIRGEVRIAGAIFVGKTRLIDNLAAVAAGL
jgi:pantoate--beta-alanine ligase